MIADEVCVAAGHLTFIDGNGLKPGKNCESLTDLDRRIRLDGLTQGQSTGSKGRALSNPGSPIFVLFYSLDETEHFLAPGMECHHVICLLYTSRCV